MNDSEGLGEESFRRYGIFLVEFFRYRDLNGPPANVRGRSGTGRIHEINYEFRSNGEMSEWFKEHAWKVLCRMLSGNL